MWTHFWDMHSGGSQKLDWAHIYIEAPEEEAKVIFYKRFGRNPDKVTCSCCGPDYSISSEESLAQLTAYHRNCAYGDGGYIEQQNDSLRKYVSGASSESVWQDYLAEHPKSKYLSLEDYMKSADATFVPAAHIKSDERHGHVPRQGYVWVDD